MPKTATATVGENVSPTTFQEVAEHTMVTAMTFNPLVVLDSSQILAMLGRVGARALVQPSTLLSRTLGLGRELGEILLGRSERAPDPSDRRFADPTFRDHPLYRRVMQSYLAWRESLHGLVDEIDLDQESRDRGKFALTLLTEAVAPTNTLLGNPAALKRAFETAGMSVLKGVRNWARDQVENHGMPSQVDKRPFQVGENLAVTPGQVIFRSEVLELIQYAPAKPKVFERPLLFIPPQVNKYYAFDLAPGRSMIEHLVQQGLQVFLVSWRNPTPAQRDWGFDTYIQSLCEALAVVQEITGSPTVNVTGVCAGGITTSIFIAHLAARGDRAIHSASFPVTVLDTSVSSQISVLSSQKTLDASKRSSHKKGILSGPELARVFALLRPNDLVWNYWINNYLMGTDPAPFDILVWNNDPTNLPAALHAEFLDLFANHALLKPGTLKVLGTPIDLSRVTCDIYAIGALTDHLTPWYACYRTPQLFGGEGTFVLSYSGHIQALVNPPGNPKAKFYTNDAKGLEANTWLAGAKEHKGTWWTHWTDWLGKRSGTEKPAPQCLGSDAHPPLMAAPGRYVHQKAA